MFQESKTHLSSVKESYFEHMFVAFRYGFSCIVAGVMALIHGLIPACFQEAASRKVQRLADKGRK